MGMTIDKAIARTMSRYRPKEFIIFFYGTIYRAAITCYPQSRWELVSKSPIKVTLRNKNITIDIAKDDFEKHWVEVQ